MIFLLSFAPLTLLGEKSRPLVLLGVTLLILSYAVLCLSQRLSVVLIPVGLGVAGLCFGTVRWKHVVAGLLVLGLIIGLFSHQILWFKLSQEYPSYRIENYLLLLEHRPAAPSPGHRPRDSPGPIFERLSD